MTTSLALEYIPRRMRELGYAQNYYLRFRHLVMQSKEQLELPAFNQIFILVEEPADVKVQSDFGLYDTTDNQTNEQIYEHQGLIGVENYSSQVNHVRFIQVIPYHKTRKYKTKK
jgi:hypothetical protein